MLAVSSELLTDDGKYTLWLDDVQIAEGISGAMEMPGPGMMPPEGYKGRKHPEKPGEKN